MSNQLRSKAKSRSSALSSAAVSSIVASVPLCATAWSAPGDLDPAFGSVGRVVDLPGLSGTVWSVQPHGEGLVLGAGDRSYSVDYQGLEAESLAGFAAWIGGDGSPDAARGTVTLEGTYVRDVAVQGDGRLLGVGWSRPGEGTVFTAFRLGVDGVPDATFGEDGFVRGPGDPGLQYGVSVVLDDTGRAVIAGQEDGRLVVIRLLSNGEVDATFGAAGLYSADVPSLSQPGPDLVSVPGGYRVTMNNLAWSRRQVDPTSACRIIALRDDGVLDTTFGDGGRVLLGPPDPTPASGAHCAALSTQSDGRLIVAGRFGDRGFALRLLENGAEDPLFSAPEVARRMVDVTALAVLPDDSLLLAGRGEAGISGTLVLRLRPDGRADTTFGDGGDTWIDLPSDFLMNPRWWTPVVQDILPMADGGAVLVGRDDKPAGERPFAARLLGDTGRSGPGVIGIERVRIAPVEGAGQVAVSVRRSGGRAGTVSVAYATRSGPRTPDPGIIPFPATAGQDYVATTGRLTWSDGDSGPKQVVIELLGGDRTVPGEVFYLELSDARGGSGLGSRTARIELIGSSASGASTVELELSSLDVEESNGTISIDVRRGGSFEGAISATLVADSGTATAGSDFRFDGTTVEWADGDSSVKTVTIPMIDDHRREPPESFTVRIESTTNGALIGSGSSTTVRIEDDDEASPSGGGWVGLLPLLLLSMGAASRAARRTL